MNDIKLSAQDASVRGLSAVSGVNPIQVFSDTELHTPVASANGKTFKIIHALEDTTFAKLTCQATTDGSTEATAADWGTLEAGEDFVASFTEIQLISGKVVAYQ